MMSSYLFGKEKQMAIVRKCDICGEIYNQYPTKTETYMEISTIKSIEGCSTAFGRKERDCCSGCTVKILGFIDVLKQYPNTHCIQVFDEEPLEPKGETK